MNHLHFVSALLLLFLTAPWESSADIHSYGNQTGATSFRNASNRQILQSPYRFSYFGPAFNADACRIWAKANGFTHFYYGLGRFSNGHVANNLCFGALLEGAVVPPPQNSVALKSPFTPDKPGVSRDKIWVKDSYTTPVTQNENTFQNLFDALAKKMETRGELAPDPKGPWYTNCLIKNFHFDPSFAPFLATSKHKLGRPDLFAPIANSTDFQFGDFRQFHDQATNAYSHDAVLKGKMPSYQSISQLKGKGHDSDTSQIKVTLDTEVKMALRFFSAGSETIGLARVQHDFVHHPTEGDGEYPHGGDDQYCLYSKNKMDENGILETATRLGLFK